jgi:hypothetical protein
MVKHLSLSAKVPQARHIMFSFPRVQYYRHEMAQQGTICPSHRMKRCLEICIECLGWLFCEPHRDLGVYIHGISRSISKRTASTGQLLLL